MENEKLTPKQIENWRKVLFLTLGSYAFIMSDEEVQKTKDNMQEKVNTDFPDS